MHIVINGLLLSSRPSGIGQYILHLVQAMIPQLQVQERLTLLVPEDLDRASLPFASGENLDILHVPVPSNKPARRILWEQTTLPGLAERWRASLLFSPAYALPVRLRIPGVVTVHDLAFMRYADVHPRPNRMYLTWITRLSVKRAERIIAVSESTKQELVELLAVPSHKIAVIHNGVSSRFRRAAQSEVLRIRERYELPEKYILYVGNIEPRKNLPLLLQAFDQLKSHADIPHQLVILGQRAWLHGAVDNTWQGLKSKAAIRFTGYVPADDLPALYSGAEVFVYPSLYEGFGLPILEAMACGTPVITSSTSSMPEVAGDAAELVDPHSVDALSNALLHLLKDGRRRHELVQKGLRRAAEFTWDRTSRLTLELLRAVTGHLSLR